MLFISHICGAHGIIDVILLIFFFILQCIQTCL